MILFKSYYTTKYILISNYFSFYNSLYLFCKPVKFKYKVFLIAIGKMRVNEIMNKAIVVDHDMNLKEAAQIMSNRNIGSLIVLKNNKIAGIITERDILKNISSLGRRISGVMSKKVVTLDHGESLDNAALIMTENKVKRLPIVDGNRLVGIITATDIVANSDVLSEDFFLD